MNYGEGYRTLHSPAGRELKAKLTRLEKDQINHLKEGDRLIHLGNRRIYQWAFEVTGFGMDYWDRIIVKLSKLTPTGKVSKAKSNQVKFYLEDLDYDCFEYYEGAVKDIEHYIEETKKPVATGDMRDYQRQKVYKAEQKVARELEYQFLGEHDDAEEYCNDIMRSRYVDIMFPNIQFRKRVDLVQNRKMNFVWIYSGSQKIEYNPNRKCALTKYVMLHELAHIFAPNDEHGAEFTTAYLILLKEFYPEFYKRLRSVYDARSIDYNKEKINQIEKKQQLV